MYKDREAYKANSDCCNPVPQITTSQTVSLRDSILCLVAACCLLKQLCKRIVEEVGAEFMDVKLEKIISAGTETAR